MTDEEKKDILFQIDMQLYDEFNDEFCEMNDNLGIFYTYKDIDDLEKLEKEKEIKLLREAIKKQSKEIEHQKEKRENQKKELAILNAKQVEFNKLVNTVNSYKGQFKRQQKEIEELKEIYQTGYVNGCVSKVYEINKKWEDKIKAKIEEVSNGTYDAKIVLQSLLEKE